MDSLLQLQVIGLAIHLFRQINSEKLYYSIIQHIPF